MFLSNYKNFLINQCANCSLFLTSENNKSTFVTHNVNSINILSSASAQNDIPNSEAISYVYGISLRYLTEKLKSYFIEYGYQCGEEHSPESEELNEIAENAEATVLALCEKCGPIFEELYTVSKVFRNLSDRNSLIWKVLEEQGFEANLKNGEKDDEYGLKEEEDDSNIDPILSGDEEDRFTSWNEPEIIDSNSENAYFKDMKPKTAQVDSNFSYKDLESHISGNGRRVEGSSELKDPLAEDMLTVPSSSIKMRLRKQDNGIKTKLSGRDSDDNYSPRASEESEQSDAEFVPIIHASPRKGIKRKNKSRAKQKNHVQLRDHYDKVECVEGPNYDGDSFKFKCKACPGIFNTRTLFHRHYLNHHFEGASVHEEIIDGPPFKCPKCESKYKCHRDLERHCARVHHLKLIRQKAVRPQLHMCPDCGASYDSSQGFLTHVKRKHGKKLYMCRVCKEIFPVFAHMKLHTLSHSLPTDKVNSEKVETPKIGTPHVKIQNTASKRQENDNSNIEPIMLNGDEENCFTSWNEPEISVLNSEDEYFTEAKPDTPHADNNCTYKDLKSINSETFRHVGENSEIKDPLSEDLMTVPSSSFTMQLRNNEVKSKMSRRDTDANPRKEIKIKYKSRAKQKNHFQSRDHYEKVELEDAPNCDGASFKYKCKTCSCIFNTRRLFHCHYLLRHYKGASVHEEVINGPPFQCPKCESKYKSHADLERHCARFHHLKLISQKEVRQQLHTCTDCGASYDTSQGFLGHTKRKHGKKLYMCRLCKEIFPVFADMRLHKLSHSLPTENVNSDFITPKIMPQPVASKTRVNDNSNIEPMLSSNEENCFTSWNEAEISVLNSDEEYFTETKPETPHAGNNCTYKDLKSENYGNGRRVIENSETKEPLSEDLLTAPSSSFKMELRNNDGKTKMSVRDTDEKCSKESEQTGVEFVPTSHANPRKEIKRKYKSRAKQTNHFQSRDHYEKIESEEGPNCDGSSFKYKCKTCSCIFNARRLFHCHYLLRHYKGASVHEEIINGPPFQCPKCESKYKYYADLERHCARFHHLKLISQKEVRQQLHTCTDCGTSYDTSHSFLIHLKRKHGKKNYMCRICKKIFPDFADMRRHKLSHSLLTENVTSDKVETPKIRTPKVKTQNVAPKENTRNLEEEIQFSVEPEQFADELFYCRACNYKFKCRGGLSVHLQKSHGCSNYIEKYDCKDCSENFEFLPSFLNHMADVHKEYARPEEYVDLYSCTEVNCTMKFRKLSYYMDHRKETEHSNFKVMCAFCEETFTVSETLNEHKLTSHKEIHSRMEFLKQSIKKSESNRSYTCPFCDNTFSSKREELQHRASHPEEERTYKCKECNLPFSKYNHWSNHYVMYHRDADKDFKCETCGKKFNGLRQLRLHCRRHAQRATGVRPMCEVCGKSYSTSYSLSKHKIVTHDRRQQKTCHLCGHISQTMYNLKLHLKVHEKNGIFRNRKNMN